jgi:hypothetical protein
VVIFAPANCPSAAAQRADALARHLDRAGVPYRRAQSADFGSLKSQEDVDRVMAVMNGEIPVVFVRTRARANPSGEDVVADIAQAGCLERQSMAPCPDPEPTADLWCSQRA